MYQRAINSEELLGRKKWLNPWKNHQVMTIKINQVFFPDPDKRIYTKEELFALRMHKNFIADIASRLDLAYTKGDESEGNLCLANSKEVQPEYRSTFSKIDILYYCSALLPDEVINTEMYELSLPVDAPAFWRLVEAGRNKENSFYNT